MSDVYLDPAGVEEKFGSPARTNHRLSIADGRYRRQRAGRP